MRSQHYLILTIYPYHGHPRQFGLACAPAHASLSVERRADRENFICVAKEVARTERASSTRRICSRSSATRHAQLLMPQPKLRDSDETLALSIPGAVPRPATWCNSTSLVHNYPDEQKGKSGLSKIQIDSIHIRFTFF